MRNFLHRLVSLNTWSPVVGDPRNPFMVDLRVYDEINPPLSQWLLISVYHSNGKADWSSLRKDPGFKQSLETQGWSL